MKAIVLRSYGPVSGLRIGEAPDPVPGKGEVLVGVRAAGVDPGVWHTVTGLPYIVRLGLGLRRPRSRVAGRDVAGVVAAIGDGVTRFRPGDEVFGVSDAGYAELVVTREDHLASKPANVGFEAAAAVPTSGVTALHAVRDAGRVGAGQRVLVIGAAGGVGSFAVQLAKLAGAHVSGLCGPDKAEAVRSLGADAVLDYTQGDPAQEYDAVIDTAGNRPLRALRRLLTPRGTLVLVGGEGGGRWFGGIDRALRALLASMVRGQRLRPLLSVHKDADLRHLADLLAAGSLTPLVSRTFPLAEAAAAVTALEAGHTKGKLVLSV
jgi:NADPH:quinone reductase-like Zn-dependent oxidoreductase